MLSDFFDTDSLLVSGSVKDAQGVILLRIGMGRGDTEEFVVISLNKSMAESLVRELKERTEKESASEKPQETKTTAITLSILDTDTLFEEYLHRSKTYIEEWPIMKSEYRLQEIQALRGLYKRCYETLQKKKASKFQ